MCNNQVWKLWYFIANVKNNLYEQRLAILECLHQTVKSQFFREFVNHYRIYIPLSSDGIINCQFFEFFFQA